MIVYLTNYGDGLVYASFIDCVFINNEKWAIWSNDDEDFNNDPEFFDNQLYVERCSFQSNTPIDIDAPAPFTCLSSCPGESCA